MSKVACPYCYHRIELAKLHFQCTGRVTPGRQRCAKAVDEERKRLTGYASPSWPTFPRPPSGSLRLVPCPDCGTPSGIRACPVCHTPLPANFADSRSPLIGMVGGKNAGKTVYTTVLAHEIRHNIRRRFAADIWFAGDQQGGIGSVSDWLADYEQALFTDSRLFESTASAADGIKVPLVLQWRQPKRSLGREVHSTTTLSFYDAAGEDMTTQEFVNAQAYLTSADGLIVLLDPFQLKGAQDRIKVPAAGRRDSEPPINVLTRITELLRTSHAVPAKRKIQIPVAVVFSKIDAFFPVLGDGHPLLRAPDAGPYYDEAHGRDTDEHLRALLAELDADDIDAHLRAHYKSFRYFAVSSLGAEPDYDRNRVDAGGVRPFRVDEPLLWLLGLFKVVARSNP
ncbi:MAG TPA: zinc ribbon domain-containing protein [Amycolatopsis sp.]|uniref:zinc ribbon domain-containing protein n=1 Tax=Amycolatopsis sp. TaxID=37632 RepID=UPI002B493D40|nr:zinc ribbon domain-containing protein [Amycolatopsis sp.]HKS48322.1 zinc ribbon domain-containing protein [Amycolatopsis sp.]